MTKILDNLFTRYPFLYDRAFCAAFHPYNLYSIRRLNPYITTALLYVPNLTTYIIRNASQNPEPKSNFFVKNLIVRWIMDSVSMWFCSPIGLKFLGANLACIEHHQISQTLLDEYKKAGIILCAWCVNEPEQRRWLRANKVTIFTDKLFDIDDK